jgi:hypothetical protein
VVEKTIGRVGAGALLGANEVAVVHRVGRELEQLLGQTGFFGEQAVPSAAESI